ncbi:hypothetical protein SNE40_005917 [Patella caerulea]|uniref:Uncharacterized protein n=1 Tax=Patella caerulea TaxID=87958 RepID=A0AAN8PWU5_PATCE
MKMVPLCYILMSRRREIDNIKVLRKLMGLMPEEPNVKCATMDFEAARWRRCQELGLQKKYRTHKGTSDFIRKLMSLPFLPKSHILEVFQQLKATTSCPGLL